VLITNRFDLDADEIAEIYKSRWAIELFFKWMKQHLSIKKFYGHSDQAVYNQVYLAMIVYCLHVLAQLNTESNRSYLQISRLLKASLWKPAYVWQHKIQGRGVPKSFPAVDCSCLIAIGKKWMLTTFTSVFKLFSLYPKKI